MIRQNYRVIFRLIFASIWAIDAYLKWVCVYCGLNLADRIHDASLQPNPSIVTHWIVFWDRMASSDPNFTLQIAILETLITLFLFLGFFTSPISAFGIVFSIIIWSTAENFGGILQQGAPDIGASPLYTVIFVMLIITGAGRQKSIDVWLSKKIRSLSDDAESIL